MNINIKTMRLDQDQLNRLGEMLNFLGLGKDDTATTKTALNYLENVLQGDLMLNLISSIELVKDNNTQLSKVKRAINNLKRNTKY